MTILPHPHNPQDNIGTVTESAAQRTGFSAELRYTRALETRVPHTASGAATLVNTTSISALRLDRHRFARSCSPTSQVLRIWHLAEEGRECRAIPQRRRRAKWLPAYSPMAITQRRISLSKHPNLAPTVCYACHIWWGAIPVMNPNIRGAYVGLDPDTAKADMMCRA
ncbi:MAG: hypothetical protein ACLS6O_07075 [Bifidobacterium sp.]